MDGQRNLGVCSDEPVRISIAPLRLSLVQHPDYRYFSVVRTKLNWSGSPHWYKRRYPENSRL